MSTASYAEVVERVRATIAAYTQALDDGRVEDVVATFCADGMCDMPGLGKHQGHAALREAYERVKPRRPQRHLVVNTLVTEWSEHEVRATSDIVLLLKGESGWSVQIVGRYQDTLRCEGGAWRFSHRVATFA